MQCAHEFVLARILHALPLYGYRFSTEAEFHRGIATALDAHQVEYLHEHQATKEHRFDFVCSGVVIEAKIKGSLAPALEQVEGYCGLPSVKAVVIVSSRQWARSQQQMLFHGVPVHILYLQPQAF